MSCAPPATSWSLQAASSRASSTPPRGWPGSTEPSRAHSPGSPTEEQNVPVLNDAAREVVTGGNLAHIVTLNEDGSPNVVCIWTGLDGDDIVSAHLSASQKKLQNVRRDPRVVLSYEPKTRNDQDIDEHLVVY